ncbi:MAG: dihydroneopterin aldolase [Microbacteriaceae bacterium]|nr:dihydroneopterin aldolase [Burkholderiaceae bacterium]
MQSLLTNPSLMDCRRLFLRDYEVWINIGVHDFEKKGEQRVKINVDLYVPLAMSTPTNDQLDEVLDYDFIRRSITERVSQGHIHLQETLADDVLKLMLAHPCVRAARVATEKPDVYPDCDAVGCEVFGMKESA